MLPFRAADGSLWAKPRGARREPSMTEDATTRLFVYGTLKPGFGNHARIEHLVRSSQAASTEGALIDLGAFPAMVPGQGQVNGVLLEMDEEALTITDRIEGCQGEGENNLYNRRKAFIRLDGGDEVTAWV